MKTFVNNQLLMEYTEVNLINNIIYQVGDTHSLSCSLSSKIHSWGWNDFGQLGVPVVDEFDQY